MANGNASDVSLLKWIVAEIAAHSANAKRRTLADVRRELGGATATRILGVRAAVGGRNRARRPDVGATSRLS